MSNDNDTNLETNVRDQLRGDASLDTSRIKIEAHDGKVVLTGVVDTLHQKLRAGEVAFRLTGVQTLRNDLIVDKSHKRVSDAELKATAQAGLDANGLVPKGAVTIDVNDGWITLGGNVHHYYERQAAERVIRHLTGAQGLTSNVTVSNDPAAEVSKAIRDSLTRSAALDAEKIAVTDTDGAVTLSGTVRTYVEKREAERSAASAPGVVSVKNDLVINRSTAN